MPVRRRVRGPGLCAPLPAAGHSGEHCWAGGCTSHRRTTWARRPHGPVCMCRNPIGGGGVLRQGGAHTGADEDGPLGKHGFAEGPDDDGGGGMPTRHCRGNDGPARVAMGRVVFLKERTERIISAHRSSVSPRIRLRSRCEKVYASPHGTREIFLTIRTEAHRMPGRSRIEGCVRNRRKTGRREPTSKRVHGSDDNPECNFGAGMLF